MRYLIEENAAILVGADTYKKEVGFETVYSSCGSRLRRLKRPVFLEWHQLICKSSDQFMFRKGRQIWIVGSQHVDCLEGDLPNKHYVVAGFAGNKANRYQIIARRKHV